MPLRTRPGLSLSLLPGPARTRFSLPPEHILVLLGLCLDDGRAATHSRAEEVPWRCLSHLCDCSMTPGQESLQQLGPCNLSASLTEAWMLPIYSNHSS